MHEDDDDSKHEYVDVDTSNQRWKLYWGHDVVIRFDGAPLYVCVSLKGGVTKTQVHRDAAPRILEQLKHFLSTNTFDNDPIVSDDWLHELEPPPSTALAIVHHSDQPFVPPLPANVTREQMRALSTYRAFQRCMNYWKTTPGGEDWDVFDNTYIAHINEHHPGVDTYKGERLVLHWPTCRTNACMAHKRNKRWGQKRKHIEAVAR